MEACELEEDRDEVLATAFLRAIQALETMLGMLRRTARAAAGVRETAVARRLDELAGDVEQSLLRLRMRAAARRPNSACRRNGR